MTLTRRSTRAFTLIELILVLVILAFVVAMVAPSLRGFGTGRRTRDNASEIVTLAHYARTQAITEAKTYRLNFDAANSNYWLTMDNNAGGFEPARGDFGQRVKPADGISIRCDVRPQPDGQYIQFRPDGRADQARIVLNDRLGNSIVVASLSPVEMFQVLSSEDARQ